MSDQVKRTFTEEAAYMLMTRPALYDLMHEVLKIPGDSRDEAIEKLLEFIGELKAGNVDRAND